MLYVIRVEKSIYSKYICRPYSSSNKEYIVTIRKRKISYFILNISMTLLVYRSIALNKCYNYVCIYNIYTQQIRFNQKFDI